MFVVNGTLRFIARAILAVSVLSAVGMGAANAQQSQTKAPTVREFLSNPRQLLQQYLNGGSQLANLVQQLALADPSTLKVLLGLLVNANELQKGAIGYGLAQAAKIEVLTDQPLAEDWQNQIAAIDDQAFKKAAIDGFGDVQLGAVGGGPLGGAGGGPSSQGRTTSGLPQDLRSTPVPTQQFTYTPTTTAGPSLSFAPTATAGPSLSFAPTTTAGASLSFAPPPTARSSVSLSVSP
jgi:hypothetical protein